MRPRAEWAIDSEAMRARGIIAYDILHAIDSSRAVVLLMLDLSAAFDTVYHEILLNSLSQRYGITGSVPEWFAFYLSSRTLFAQIEC